MLCTYNVRKHIHTRACTHLQWQCKKVSSIYIYIYYMMCVYYIYMFVMTLEMHYFGVALTSMRGASVVLR